MDASSGQSELSVDVGGNWHQWPDQFLFGYERLSDRIFQDDFGYKQHSALGTGRSKQSRIGAINHYH